MKRSTFPIESQYLKRLKLVPSSKLFDGQMELGYHDLIFESDCKMIVNNITSSTLEISYFHVIMVKCKAILPCIPNSRVKFIRRQAVHSLAKASIFFSCNYVHEKVPTCTESFILNEKPQLLPFLYEKNKIHIYCCLYIIL